MEQQQQHQLQQQQQRRTRMEILHRCSTGTILFVPSQPPFDAEFLETELVKLLRHYRHLTRGYHYNNRREWKRPVAVEEAPRSRGYKRPAEEEQIEVRDQKKNNSLLEAVSTSAPPPASTSSSAAVCTAASTTPWMPVKPAPISFAYPIYFASTKVLSITPNSSASTLILSSASTTTTATQVPITVPEVKVPVTVVSEVKVPTTSSTPVTTAAAVNNVPVLEDLTLSSSDEEEAAAATTTTTTPMEIASAQPSSPRRAAVIEALPQCKRTMTRPPKPPAGGRQEQIARMLKKIEELKKAK